jgi:hypothetical protein
MLLLIEYNTLQSREYKQENKMHCQHIVCAAG